MKWPGLARGILGRAGLGHAGLGHAALGRGGRSLQGRLGLRLGLLAIAVFLAAALLVVPRIHDIGDVVQTITLRRQADQLLQFLTVAPDGDVRIALPPALRQRYGRADDDFHYLVTDSQGAVLAAAKPGTAERFEGRVRWPGSGEALFDTVQEDGFEDAVYGLTRRIEGPAGLLFVTVAQQRVVDDLLFESVASEILGDLVLFALPVLLLALLIGLWTIRSSLAGLNSLSRLAAQIGPATTSLRLPEEGVVREAAPLIAAVNRAFARLEDGYLAQRRFTADAAHQLRTPLTILSARLDTLGDFAGLAELKQDVARMNRLVTQLLSAARLEAVVPESDEPADLSAIATDVARALGPLAIHGGRDLAVAGAEQPILVRGTAGLLAEALRNLVENALAHTPTGSTVEILVGRPASIEVLDRGPGVPDADKAAIFDRFRQGSHRTKGGAGLGLAIVSQILALHGGTISVSDRDGGGACFRIELPPAPPRLHWPTAPLESAP